MVKPLWNGQRLMLLRSFPDKMGFYTGETNVNESQAQALGAMLRARRKELGYSTYQLADAAGVRNSTVVRIELGRFAAPSPEKLARFAEELEMSLGEVYAKAGYIVPDDLPDFDTYLSKKYPELTKSQRRTLDRTMQQMRST
jgi:transcriptional regulator with XRE-family HTH domain